jgi:hypothetical protein
MESKEKHIKIAIRPMEPEEFESLEQWENEGGPPPSEDANTITDLPVKPGETITILSGKIIYENGFVSILQISGKSSNR